MKRYSAGEIAVATRKGDIGVDTQYIRVDHAIAAGCLVPVPDGEACDMDDLDCNHWLLLVNQRVYYREYDCDTFTTFDDNPDFIALDSAIAQPVRLVRLEDVG